jgi:hypothetical protein
MAERVFYVGVTGRSLSERKWEYAKQRGTLGEWVRKLRKDDVHISHQIVWQDIPTERVQEVENSFIQIAARLGKCLNGTASSYSGKMLRGPLAKVYIAVDPRAPLTSGEIRRFQRGLAAVKKSPSRTVTQVRTWKEA